MNGANDGADTGIIIIHSWLHVVRIIIILKAKQQILIICNHVP